MLDKRTVEIIQALIDVGSGKLAHVYNGMCPDPVEGSEVRDDECPACGALIAGQDLLKNTDEESPKNATS